MTTFEDALAIVRATIEADRAFMTAAHKALAPTGLFEHAAEVRAYHGLPDTVHAFEAAISDNWGGADRPAPLSRNGKKAHPAKAVRHSITMKVWNSPNFRSRMANPTSKLYADLRNGAELLEALKRPLKEPLDPAYVAYLQGIAPDLVGYRIGLLTSIVKGDGRRIHDWQYVLVRDDAIGHKIEGNAVMVVQGQRKFMLPAFSPLDAKSAPLAGNYVCQSRCAVSGGGHWSTGDFPSA
jgi:hypothetical protein